MTTLSNKLIHSIHTYVLSVRYVAGTIPGTSSKGELNLAGGFSFCGLQWTWEYRQSEKNSHKHEYIQSQNEIKYNKGKEQPAQGATNLSDA